ncbi:MAG TPA: elongation factor G [Verrucomicrobiae bacterium]|nr:elongation factor G [Verrucomicrobiae bacterium]
MKEYQAADIRNFSIVGHASAGKTTLSEAMLACAGEINRMGSVAAGSTVSDYHEAEQARKISIQSTLLHLEWLGKKFNVIDCPGYSDFICESLGALRASDFALVVVNAQHGVGVGTDMVWRYATEFGIPKMIVLNGFDKPEADFETALAQVREHFGSRVFPMNLPLNSGPGFNQLLDVPRSEVTTYAADQSGKFTEVSAAGTHAKQVTALHEQLIEFIAEADDSLMEKWMDRGTLTEDELRSGLHAAVQRQAFIPLFCVSAENNIGVARLMDFIAKYGSSPVDRVKVSAVDPDGNDVDVALNDGEPVLYAFKVMNESGFGDMTFFRVYAGQVKMGSDLFNADRRVSEKLGPLYLVNGKNRTSAASLNAGDIGAVVKLRDTHIGNTLSTVKRPVSLPKVQYPAPNVLSALQLKTKGDEDKLAVGIAALHEEDASFAYSVDAELHQTILAGQGELHLDVLVERLRRRFKVDLELTAPKIAYRETVKSRGESKYRHKKQTGGAGQFAEVWMRIEPKPRDTGFEFTQSLVGQNVDRGFVPSVEKGVSSACKEGILAGYRVVDLKVDFYDGKMHPVDSGDVAFQIAGKEAFREAFLQARPCLLEPIHKLTIRAPEDCLGKIIGDVSSRRGKVLGMEADGSLQVLIAEVPARELHHYATVLRSLTGGRGIHQEMFSHYEEMPRELEARVVEESKKARNNSH